ncbi:LacI family DNA-binding transcriptional regulator [Dactylosporangium salmoneum]|uniref:LacI family DNA-binding transcriptional regulator n=1 Tax=Dactylosporangium salmoneum TaxID=53361 RepID=UPI0031D79F72
MLVGTSRRRSSRDRVTGAEVAEAAGVSTSVVSLVLNGKDAGRANQATRDRVLAAARELGYRIDGRGQSLATGQTGIIGFIAPDNTTPFFASLQHGLLSRLNPEYHLLTVVTDLGQAVTSESIERMLRLGPDAIIVFALGTEDLSALRPGCPVLVLDSPGSEPHFPRIDLDVSASARALGQHLASNGHRCLAYLDGNTGSQSMEVRRRALLSAFRRGSTQARTTVARCAIDAAVARATVAAHWPTWKDAGVTAIACGSDLQAFGAIAALRDVGVAVPRDVSVTGADDQPLSTVIEPNLTTVRLPSQLLGEMAAAQVRGILNGEPAQALPTVLPTEVVFRDSTGAAPTH